MKTYYLEYRPLSMEFCVFDAVVNNCFDEGKVPLLKLAPKEYQRLGCAVPDKDAPTVGLLLGRSTDSFSIGRNYVGALAKTGVNIRFLTYRGCEEQLSSCDGLLLPGGAFDSPEAYYTDPKNDVEFPSERAKAYILCIRYALAHAMPILGICAGAQMVAGEFGYKLHRNTSYIETPIEHKSNKDEAHRLNVFAGKLLDNLFDHESQMFVNSRHREILAPIRVQCELWEQEKDTAQMTLDIYAEANDGVPEAWGSDLYHVLCVQWHPEDMAARGDEKMQRIYQWLANEIANMRQDAA